jgi:hypothetical protein
MDATLETMIFMLKSIRNQGDSVLNEENLAFVEALVGDKNGEIAGSLQRILGSSARAGLAVPSQKTNRLNAISAFVTIDLINNWGFEPCRLRGFCITLISLTSGSPVPRSRCPTWFDNTTQEGNQRLFTNRLSPPAAKRLVKSRRKNGRALSDRGLFCAVQICDLAWG